MIALSEISAPAVCPAPGPPALTDGAIAVLNLQAQIDGLEGHGTSAEAATLIDLLILRGVILGRISDYERAAQLADRLVHDAITAAGPTWRAHGPTRYSIVLARRSTTLITPIGFRLKVRPQSGSVQQSCRR